VPRLKGCAAEALAILIKAMRISERTDSRLVLTGIPGGRLWMVVLLCLGLVLTVGFGWFAVLVYKEDNRLALPLLALSIGVLIAQGLFWTGAVSLMVGRLSLVLDTTTGRGEYRVRSPIVDAGQPCKFELKHVDSVTVETRLETRPGLGGHADTEATVHRVRLRLNKPHCVIVLDESEHGELDRLQTLARQVAGLLNQTPVRIDQAGERDQGPPEA